MLFFIYKILIKFNFKIQDFLCIFASFLVFTLNHMNLQIFTPGFCSRVNEGCNKFKPYPSNIRRIIRIILGLYPFNPDSGFYPDLRILRITDPNTTQDAKQ